MSDTPQFILKHVSEVAEREGFVAYTTTVEAGSNHGDGFQGILKRIIISGSKQSLDGQQLPAELHLVCKSVPTNLVRRKEFQGDIMFQREAHMYRTVLPLFAEFQREKGLTASDSFTAYPKCYRIVSDEKNDEFVIILEDLRPKNFTLWPKKEIVPANHAYILLENLAKLHAISFALKDQRPEVFADLKNLNDLFRNFFKSDVMNQILRMGFDRSIQGLKNPEHVKIVKKFKDNIYESYHACLNSTLAEPYGVVTHGDCWINNLLFRYENDTKNPLEICLIDWQLSRYCSPVMDLFNFIATSTDGPLRKAEYENLLKYYYQTLSDSIRRLGSDPEKLFPRDAFDKELKRFGNFAFLISLWMTQLMLADPDDIPDLDEFTENLDNSPTIDLELFSKKGKEKDQEYNRRINDLVEDFLALGYYSGE